MTRNEHPVKMSAIYCGAPPFELDARTKILAECCECGAKVDDEVEGRTNAQEVMERRLYEQGCSHWAQPYTDTGALFDPRTVQSAGHIEADFSGNVVGFCPTQGFGTVDRLHWYFRSRWDEHSFCIADTKEHTNAWDETGPGVVFYREGNGGHAVTEAWEIIHGYIAEWRNGGGR